MGGWGWERSEARRGAGSGVSVSAGDAVRITTEVERAEGKDVPIHTTSSPACSALTAACMLLRGVRSVKNSQ